MHYLSVTAEPKNCYSCATTNWSRSLGALAFPGNPFCCTDSQNEGSNPRRVTCTDPKPAPQSGCLRWCCAPLVAVRSFPADSLQLGACPKPQSHPPAALVNRLDSVSPLATTRQRLDLKAVTVTGVETHPCHCPPEGEPNLT